MERAPLFSVVTACRNDLENLRATEQSIAEQTCRDFEWVVVDGASSDGTLDYLKGVQCPELVWQSESDTGIYDAFDKGARLSSGSYIVYICAGDQFCGPDTLAEVKAFIEANPGADLYYGDAYDVRAGKINGLRAARSHETIWWNLFTHHQSMFYSRRCFEIARYDVTYKIGGDYAFTAEILHKGAQAIRMPLITAKFQLGGTSYRNYWLGERDNWRTRKELGVPLSTRAWIWGAHAVIRFGRVYVPEVYGLLRYTAPSARLGGSAETQPDVYDVEGVPVHAVTLDHAVDSIARESRENGAFSIFTLNLDHVSRLRTDAVFRSAYRGARMVVPDGFPVAMAGRFRLRRSVARVCGADMIVPLCCRAARGGSSVFLLGSTADALERCRRALTEQVSDLQIAGTLAPSMTFDPHSDEADAAIDTVVQSGAGIVFVALGAPKAELFSARLVGRMRRGAVVSIGAGLDFIAGRQRRAPKALRQTGLEWAWRLAHEPRRLAGRYLRSGLVFPSVLRRAWIKDAL